MMRKAQANSPKCSVLIRLPMVTEVPFSIFKVPLRLLVSRKTNVPRPAIDCTFGNKALPASKFCQEQIKWAVIRVRNETSFAVSFDDELQLQIRRNESPAHDGQPALPVGIRRCGANQLRAAHHHHERAVVDHADFPGQPIGRNNGLLSADQCRNQQRWLGLWYGRFSGKFSYADVRKLPAHWRCRLSSKQRF